MSNVICQELPERVDLAESNVIHPLMLVRDGGGKIIIGSNNIFNEHVIIENTTPEPLTIGSNNNFETGCGIKL
jgi:hypothetical protein